MYHTVDRSGHQTRTLPIIVLLEYLWAFAVILERNSVYRFLSITDFHLPSVCMLISLLLLFAKSSGKIRKLGIETGLLLFVYSLLYFLLQSKNVSREVFLSIVLIGLPVMVMLFVTYVRHGDPFRLFYCIENIIFVLTVCSLFLWLLGSVFGVISTNSFVHINWGVDKITRGYFGLQFETSMDTTYGIENIYRNQSLFTEAPMYNLWLSIALSTEVFLRQRVSKVKFVILVAGILSTLTTTGLLFCILLLGLHYFDVITKGNAIRKVLFVLFLIVLIPAVLYSVQVIYSYKVNTYSYSSRLENFIAGWQVFTMNPFFGSGFGSLTSFESSLGMKAGFSNSIVVLLATGGLWLMVLFGLSLVGFFVYRDRMNTYSTVKFGLCYLFLYIFVSFSARYISITYWALGIVLLLNQKWQVRGRNMALSQRRFENGGRIRA